jgi:hypothetical protein
MVVLGFALTGIGLALVGRGRPTRSTSAGGRRS